MSQGVPPLPDREPGRISLESLESQLRALPPPTVPATLPSKLISAIPPLAAKSTLVGGIAKTWYWVAGLIAAGIVVLAIGYSILSRGNSHPDRAPTPAGRANDSSAKAQTEPATSPAVRKFEQAVQDDPYNAAAWLNLAKAQAELHRTSDAISSAEKALDIAHSQNRADLVKSIETWLRSIRGPDKSS
jgi:tetratricopeptide (TPR) repeat protein